jgi:hypothetical protein
MMNAENKVKNEKVKEKILVCYYHPWKLPKENIFLPVQAGKAVSGFDLGIQGDDTGDNISGKNAVFSEFTAWYWAWKNIKNIYPDIEYIGLAHYRRFFALNRLFKKQELVYKQKIPVMKNYEKLIREKLESHDIVLAKQRVFEKSLLEQYAEKHYVEDYVCLKNIIHEICPEYDRSFSHIFRKNNKVSLYCIFIAGYGIFNNYFEWLFPILFEAEKRINISEYDSYQRRVLAFLSERLLDVYVYHNKLNVIYEPVYFIEPSKIKIIKIILKKAVKNIIPYGIIERYRKRKYK